MRRSLEGRRFFCHCEIMTTAETKTISQVANSISARKQAMAVQEPKKAIIKNISAAPLWLCQSGEEMMMMLPDSTEIIRPANQGGGLVNSTGELSPAQWASRTIAQWGILAANKMVEVRQFPADSDEVEYKKARDNEEQRIQREREREERERTALEKQMKGLFGN